LGKIEEELKKSEEDGKRLMLELQKEYEERESNN
jgi:hypothetical protein